MDEEFKVGDIVQLKSGGPTMTINAAGEAMRHGALGDTRPLGDIHCQWFAGKKLEDGYFKREALKKVPEDGQAGR